MKTAPSTLDDDAESGGNETALESQSPASSTMPEPAATKAPGFARFAPTLRRGLNARGQESALHETVVMLLAGGQGQRLYPLTKDRAKPAVPFGGSYRIIDFALSNCINSGMRRIWC